MNLVIVESPAKGKTIEKYLGSDFKVLASFGHVRDLPEKKLGIDVKNNFEPEYVISSKSAKTVNSLKALAKKAKTVYLATDLDREGEAISWHIAQALNLADKNGKPKKDYQRITFHEITKRAIENSIKNPRLINIDLVNAQQARRILDRLVGYKLSPFLWKKIAKGLSAGRVQSVAVRLIVEREREIEKFKPLEYWQITAYLFKDDIKKSFPARLTKIEDKAVDRLAIKTEKDANSVEKDLKTAKYSVANLESQTIYKNPYPPFTTSTLQMEASRKLSFSAKQTMMFAQHLYEDGHITYMRTDSVSFSPEAIKDQRSTIEKLFGKQYLPEKPNIYQTKSKGAQEAHEAIRPTNFSIDKVGTKSQEQRLYELIWKRSVAAGMNPEKNEQTDLTINAHSNKLYQLQARGLKQIFDGFTRVYEEGKDNEDADDNTDIPQLKINDNLKLKDLTKEQKFTEPPHRYSEPTLVKKLEREGIGRPSTYAPIMSTIRDRGYVNMENRFFVPTEVGCLVNDALVGNFPSVVDVGFTALVEEKFDDIAEGKLDWQPMIKEFYTPFAQALKTKDKEVDKEDLLGNPEEKCPECGADLVYRVSKFGKFIACSKYPECRYNKPLEGEDDDSGTPKESKEKCPKCGQIMIYKKGRFGAFLACSDYPKCKTTMAIPTGIKCPDCQKGDVVARRTKRGRVFWGCSTYPDCKYATWDNPTKIPEK